VSPDDLMSGFFSDLQDDAERRAEQQRDREAAERRDRVQTDRTEKYTTQVGRSGALLEQWTPPLIHCRALAYVHVRTGPWLEQGADRAAHGAKLRLPKPQPVLGVYWPQRVHARSFLAS